MLGEKWRSTETQLHMRRGCKRKFKKEKCGICNILIQVRLKYSGPEHMDCKKSYIPQPVPMQTTLIKLSGAHTKRRGLKKIGFSRSDKRLRE